MISPLLGSTRTSPIAIMRRIDEDPQVVAARQAQESAQQRVDRLQLAATKSPHTLRTVDEQLYAETMYRSVDNTLGPAIIPFAIIAGVGLLVASQLPAAAQNAVAISSVVAGVCSVPAYIYVRRQKQLRKDLTGAAQKLLTPSQEQLKSSKQRLQQVVEDATRRITEDANREAEAAVAAPSTVAVDQGTVTIGTLKLQRQPDSQRSA